MSRRRIQMDIDAAAAKYNGEVMRACDRLLQESKQENVEALISEIAGVINRSAKRTADTVVALVGLIMVVQPMGYEVTSADVVSELLYRLARSQAAEGAGQKGGDR